MASLVLYEYAHVYDFVWQLFGIIKYPLKIGL